MFYFQQLLQQGLDGIDRTAMIPAMVGIAYSVLLIGFLIGLYHSSMRGGDVQSLAITAIKYLVVAIILANWSAAFREVNDSCNQVAQFIGNSSGAGDMFLSWFDQLKEQFSNSGTGAILPAISASFAAVATALMVLAAYLIYAMMVVIFAFFYVLYGCVLYVLGPVVLALFPMAGVGQLAKSYASNLMVWNAWGLLYATFGSLITAIQFNRIDVVMNQGFLSGFFLGSSQSTILGLVSIFYALALGLIPFMARRLISGDVGGTAYSMVRAGAAAAGSVVSALAGYGAGAASATGTVAAGVSGASTSSPGSTAVAGSSAPPPQPSLAQTIRNGVISVVNGGAPPASAPDPGGSGAAPNAGSGSDRLNGDPVSHRPSSSGFSNWGFRPAGVTQTVAFHAGKLAGSIAGGKGRTENDNT
jgi:hypothetical protein